MRKKLKKLLKKAVKTVKGVLSGAGKLGLSKSLADKALKKLKSVKLSKKSKTTLAVLLALAVAASGYQAVLLGRAKVASAFSEGCTYGGASILGMFFGPMALENREQIFRKGCDHLADRWVNGKLKPSAAPEVEHDKKDEDEE